MGLVPLEKVLKEPGSSFLRVKSSLEDTNYEDENKSTDTESTSTLEHAGHLQITKIKLSHTVAGRLR